MRFSLLPAVLLSSLALTGCAQPGCDPDLECALEGETGTSSTGDGDGDPTTTGDGDGDPTTTGDGDGDPTTTGDGDGDPGTGDCSPGGVSDVVSLISSMALPPGAASWSCTVSSVELVASGGQVDFDCVDPNSPGPQPNAVDLNVNLSAEDPSLALPFELDQEVSLVTYYDNFGPGFTSYVIRGANDELLLVRVDGDGAEPWAAEDGWIGPLGPVTLEATTCVSGSQTQQFVVVDGEGLAEPVSVRSSTAGDLSLDAGDFALRVNYATKDPEIDGGCNTCVNYTILAKQG